MLTPIVKWAQNDDVIDITLLLTDVSDPVVEISQGALSFTGTELFKNYPPPPHLGGKYFGQNSLFLPRFLVRNNSNPLFLPRFRIFAYWTKYLPLSHLKPPDH